MSTIAYNQGNLLSCLESHIIETATLTLKLSSPRCEDLGGWSSLQSLPNTTSKDSLPTYVHPLAKPSSSFYYKLSEKSLKFCTENLGSETGTDIAESAIFSSDSLPESTLPNHRETLLFPPLPRQAESRNRNEPKNKSRNFPPPLTTISGANSLRVRSRRDGGRLIIMAVQVPPKHAYFQAERSHGRLRLSFFDDSFTRSDSDITGGEETDQTDETNVEDEGENDERVEVERDMEGNILDSEVEMGMEKYQRLRRCMDSGHSNKALCDLKPLWVATS